jgi:hypothetical protein
MYVHAGLPLPALLVLATTLLCAPADADVVTLNSGRKIEGQTKRTKAGLELEGRFGKTLIPWNQIKNVEERETAPEAFKRRRATLAPGDLPAAAELGLFAHRNKLQAEARQLLLPLAKLQPRNLALKGALEEMLFHFDGKVWIAPEVYFPSIGWKRHGGKWRSPLELARINASIALRAAKKERVSAREAARVAVVAAQRALSRVALREREVDAAQGELLALPTQIRAAEVVLAARQADLSHAEQALLIARNTHVTWQQIRWSCPLRPCGHVLNAQQPTLCCRVGQLCNACATRCTTRRRCVRCRAHVYHGQQLWQAINTNTREVSLRGQARDNALAEVQRLALRLRRAPVRVADAKRSLKDAQRDLPAARARAQAATLASRAADAAVPAAKARLAKAKQAAKKAPAPR